MSSGGRSAFSRWVRSSSQGCLPRVLGGSRAGRGLRGFLDSCRVPGQPVGGSWRRWPSGLLGCQEVRWGTGVWVCLVLCPLPMWLPSGEACRALVPNSFLRDGVCGLRQLWLLGQLASVRRCLLSAWSFWVPSFPCGVELSRLTLGPGGCCLLPRWLVFVVGLLGPGLLV